MTLEPDDVVKFSADEEKAFRAVLEIPVCATIQRIMDTLDEMIEFLAGVCDRDREAGL